MNMTSGSLPSVIDVYERHGPAWARLRGAELIERAWLDRFCALLPAGSTVLDIGCGSGVPIAVEMIRRGFAVTGVDGAAAMVALFRRNLPHTPILHADMRRLAFSAKFSGLLAWDSFFHLAPADQRPMFARFSDHAMPGAPLMFTSGIEEGSAVGNLEGTPLYHGSLRADEYRTLLDGGGFDVMAHVEEDPTCGFRTIWLAKKRDQPEAS